MLSSLFRFARLLRVLCSLSCAEKMFVCCRVFIVEVGAPNRLIIFGGLVVNCFRLFMNGQSGVQDY